MGKGTDKLYITHSEWSSSDAYSASVGANTSARTAGQGASFRRLPFNFCAASLQPFKNPVCTPEGTIFDINVIGAWLDKHPNQNPVDGKPLQKKDLIKLQFARNSQSTSPDSDSSDLKCELIDPVTFKVFTNNTYIVAIRHGTYANVFAWETVERMHIKPRMWQDLVDDKAFTRADIITLQDPQNTNSRNLDQFKYLQDGQAAQLTEDQPKARNCSNLNAEALGSMGHKVLKARAAVERARRAREDRLDINRSASALIKSNETVTPSPQSPLVPQKKESPNCAAYTNGKAAASFTSTGLTPETSGERALLTDEEFMLKTRRIKTKGYVRMSTNLGDLTIELQTETAPKAVWNFLGLAKKGYYDGISFHRNIPGFMIQGGDPSGTGKGGSSVWGKYFNDEIDGPLTHDARGIGRGGKLNEGNAKLTTRTLVSMANKGKNTNSSQFFFTYKPVLHLDRKHTIFGRITSGLDVLDKMENTSTDGANRPLHKISIKNIAILIDPFEEFQTQRREEQRREGKREEIRRQGGTDDDRITWTGKRIKGDGRALGEGDKRVVGKYLKAVASASAAGNGAFDGRDVDIWEEPAKKKFKGGGFGNFDSW